MTSSSGSSHLPIDLRRWADRPLVVRGFPPTVSYGYIEPNRRGLSSQTSFSRGARETAPTNPCRVARNYRPGLAVFGGPPLSGRAGTCESAQSDLSSVGHGQGQLGPPERCPTAAVDGPRGRGREGG